LRFDSHIVSDILDRWPLHLQRRRRRVPPEFGRFLSRIHVHLIETQRLLNPPTRHRRKSADESDPQRATVVEFSQDITRRISQALEENSRRSQELDRKFPRRLMTDKKLPVEATEDAIRERY
jgi:hypothetical protein